MYNKMNNRSATVAKRIVLILVALCLLFGLVPVADFDLDGALDTFQTEGDLLVWSYPTGALLIFLLSPFLTAHLNARPQLSFLLVPPPIISI